MCYDPGYVVKALLDNVGSFVWFSVVKWPHLKASTISFRTNKQTNKHAVTVSSNVAQYYKASMASWTKPCSKPCEALQFHGSTYRQITRLYLQKRISAKAFCLSLISDWSLCQSRPGQGGRIWIHSRVAVTTYHQLWSDGRSSKQEVCKGPCCCG